VGTRKQAMMTLWHPVGPAELSLVRMSGWRAWPPRLPDQPIFYPVLNEAYAIRIARDWNVPASGAGFVTRFEVEAGFARRYPVRRAGGRTIEELWVPAEELQEFNAHLAGPIEVVRQFHAPGYGPLALRVAQAAAGREPADEVVAMLSVAGAAALYRRALAADAAAGRVRALVTGLSECGTRRDVDVLLPYLKHESPRVRAEAVRAVRRLGASITRGDAHRPCPGGRPCGQRGTAYGAGCCSDRSAVGIAGRRFARSRTAGSL
jgi:hypothetical protein